ncbi:MAG: DUF3365 domain-containing protein [Sulfuricella sp.]|nr:DUF3365 domain-containing protein [Sulfuricella sp.]
MPPPLLDKFDSIAAIQRSTVLGMLAWSLVIGVSLAWNVSLQRHKTFDMAKAEAMANINKDFAFRQWATSHGGVYVPVNPKTNTVPNPYLEHVKERDIQTPSGRQLTLMNPAYMLRQMQQNFDHLYGVRGRITSLKPLNPGNAPDAWEARILQSFEGGVKEHAEITDLNGKPYLRAMRPFITEQGCLKCHGHQGYKVGDIRGGVGAYVKLEPYLATEKELVGTLTLTHGGIWLLGLAGIGAMGWRGMRRTRQSQAYLNALQESEERTRLLINSTAEGIFGIDMAGNCIFCNQAALSMMGILEESTVIGQNLHRLLYHTQPDGTPRPPEECRLLDTLKNQESVRLADELLWRADGTSFPAEIASYPVLRDEAIVGAVVSFHDISERKHAAEILAKRTEELSRSNRELEQFAYVASHDLQEPLRMVASYTQLLARRYKGKLDQDADEFIAFAVDGANRMQRLINDLLTFSRVSTRGQPFAPTDFNAILGEVLDNLQIAIQESGANVTRDELPTLMADPTQIAQLLQNLIGNAIKFHSDAPLHIHVGAAHSEGEWVFSVSDNGIGIAPEFFERIFIIFQRLNPRDQYPGTGIGLAVCKRIIERHGGRIWVESTPDQGSVFRFTLSEEAPDEGEIGKR